MPRSGSPGADSPKINGPAVHLIGEIGCQGFRTKFGHSLPVVPFGTTSMNLLLLAQEAPESGGTWATLVESDSMVVLIVFTAGAIIAVTGILAGIAKQILIGRTRERTRQEVAAYVAEGTMTADEGERLLKAGTKNHPDSK